MGTVAKQKKIVVLLNVVVVLIIAYILIKLLLPFYIDKRIDTLLTKKNELVKIYLYNSNKKFEEYKREKEKTSEKFAKNKLEKFIKQYPFFIPTQSFTKEKSISYTNIDQELKNFLTFDITKTDEGNYLYSIDNPVYINGKKRQKYKSKLGIEENLKEKFCYMKDLNKDEILNLIDEDNNKKSELYESIMDKIANISTYNGFIGEFFMEKKDICLKYINDGDSKYLYLFKNK